MFGAASSDWGVLPWYALRVRSNAERLAYQALTGKGFETFLPSYVSRRSWSDRVKVLELPLYPGYLFCRFDFDRRLPVLQSFGVLDVVGDGHRGIPIEEDEIASVRKIVNSDLKATPWPFLRNGQMVQVVKGPLRGVEGILLQQKKNYRLIVSISLLQRSVNVEIEGEWVRPIVSAHKCKAPMN